MKNITLLIVGLVVLAIAFFAYNSRKSQNNILTQKSEGSGEVQLVTPIEFSDLIKEGEGFLVDVHTPEQTHIPGTDAFIQYNAISENISQLPEDKDTPILVYCRSGSMSKSASQEISDLGYKNVYDLDGGINAYKEHNTEVAITPSNQDLSTVVYGDVPTTTFTLTNFAPLPLKITRVSTSCGCTSAEAEKNELGAYESTKIKVSFDPAVHGDATDVGELTRTIYIETDNPNFPKFENTITANVIKED